jgi:23S rRNA (cytidine2498-2'-O)-methyltransferase
MSRHGAEAEQALVTCAPESEAFALQELHEIVPELPRPVWLDDGLALSAPSLSFTSFAAETARHAPVFIRHIAPVQVEVTLRAEESDLMTLQEAALALSDRLDPMRTFAVQARVLAEGSLPYRKFTLNSLLSEQLEAQTGAVMECRRPEQVVSVLCTPTQGYLGVSRADQNRSVWPGGEQRFKREEAQISRAEFKLLEALSVFGLQLPSQGAALDLGAAPGGWTRVLRSHGLKVVAVDPADLDARVRRDRSVNHIRKRVQDYLPCPARFAVLVNDMRMDALDSVAIMQTARACLETGGLGILTLKLPHAVGMKHDSLATVRLALERLRQDYTVLGARQLYHNRSEVTVALQASQK